MTSLPPRARAVAHSFFLLPALALAFSACGGGPSPSPTPPVPVQPSPPGVPQNVRVTDRGENFIAWQWDPVSGAAGYQVQVSIGDNSFSPPDEEAALAGNQTAVRFEDEELAPGTSVYLRVRAFAGTQAAPVYGQFSGAVSGMTAGAPPPMEDDRDRLVALYVATGGEDWRNDENWLSDRPIDEWHGVETDGEGRVVSLDLGDNDLEGEIPADLGGLDRLRAVDLGGNRLRGVIPPELARLTAVQTVDLSENELIGDIPPDLAEWGQLGDLDLSDNRLTGGIPSRLGGGGTVRRLDLGNNRLTGEIPPDLAEWGQLEELDLGQNELYGEIPQAFGRLSPIRSVDLSGNRLSGRIPELSGEWMDYLENLDLGHNEFSGSIPATIGDARRLTGLDLGSNRLTGRIPPELGNLRDLVELDLGNDEELPAGTAGRAAQTTGPEGGNALTGPIPPELGGLVRLELLDLSGNELAGTVPRELANLTALVVLSLANNAGLTGDLPAEFTALVRLEVLLLQGTSVTIPDTPDFQIWLVRIPTVSVPEPVPEPPPGDRAVLEVLYRATDGDNWKDNTGWLTDAPLGDWFGVQTNDDGRVLELRLDDNDLSGALPAELDQLDQLSRLSLGFNRVSGSIPREFARLTSLTTLVLRANSLGGSIPRELGQLANLEVLHLNDNSLSGAIPRELGQLTNLRQLWLGGNELSGSIPRELGQLTNLTRLELYWNQLSGSIPREISQLTDLTHLWLAGNQLRGSIPPELGQLTGMTALWLSGNQLNGPLPTELGRLKNLTTFRVDNNDLSGPIPAWLGQLTDLTWLWLSGNRFSGSVPPELGQLTSLTQLELGNTDLTGTLPDTVTSLTALEYLVLPDGVCVPTGGDFDAWLNRIGYTSPDPVSRCAVFTASIVPPDPEDDRECSGWLFCPDDGTNEATAMASINPASTVEVSEAATIAPEWISGAAALAVAPGEPSEAFRRVRWDALQRDVLREGATFRIQARASGETVYITCGPFECTESAAAPPDPPGLGSRTAATCDAWDPTLELDVGWIENQPTYEEQRGLDLGWRYTAGLDFSVEHSFQGVPNGRNLSIAGPDGEAASRSTPLAMQDSAQREFPLNHYEPAISFRCVEFPGSVRRPEECFRVQMASSSPGAANYLSGYSVSLAPRGGSVTWGRIPWEEFTGVSCPPRTFDASGQVDVCRLFDEEVALVLAEELDVLPWQDDGAIAGSGLEGLDRSYLVWESDGIEGRRFSTLFVDLDGDGAFDREETRFHFGFDETSIRGPSFLDGDGDPLSDIGKIDVAETPDDPPDGIADNDGNGAWSDQERECSRSDGGRGEDLCDAEQTFTVTPRFAAMVGFGCRTTATIEVKCTWDAQGGLRGARPDAADVAGGEVSIEDFLRCDAEVQR